MATLVVHLAVEGVRIPSIDLTLTSEGGLGSGCRQVGGCECRGVLPAPIGRDGRICEIRIESKDDLDLRFQIRKLSTEFGRKRNCSLWSNVGF